MPVFCGHCTSKADAPHHCLVIPRPSGLLVKTESIQIATRFPNQPLLETSKRHSRGRFGVPELYYYEPRYIAGTFSSRFSRRLGVK